MTQTSNVFVPIAGGVKSAHSDRLMGAASPRLLSASEGVIQLANCIVDRFWQVIKRWGGTVIPDATVAGGTRPPPWRIAGRGTSLVSLSSYGAASPAYTWSPTAAVWIPATSTQRGPAKFTRNRVASGAALESPDYAYLPGYYATAHLDRFGTPCFTLLDETSHEVILQDTNFFASDNSTHIKVVACNGTFSMFYAAIGQAVKVATYSPTTLARVRTVSLGGGVLPSTTRANLDAIAINATTIKVVYQNGADTQLRYVDYVPSNGTSSTGELTDHSAGHLKQDAMSFVRDIALTGKVSLITVGGDSSSNGALGSAMMGGGAQLHYDITAGTPAATQAIDGGAIVAGQLPVMRVTSYSLQGAPDFVTMIEQGGTAIPIPNVDDVAFATATFLNDHAFGDPDYLPGSTPPATAVGATLTALGNGTLVVDGSSPTAGQRILVKDQPGDNIVTNGIYIVTDPGSAGTVWVLTRATDFDSANELGVDVIVKVTGGSTNAGKYFTRYGTPTQMETQKLGSSFLSNKPTGTPISFASLSITPGNDRAHRSVLFCRTNIGGSSSHATWMLGLGISSHPFVMGGSTFLIADYDNTPYAGQTQPLQSSLFMIEIPANGSLPSILVPPVSQANIAVGNGGGLVPPQTLFGRVLLSNVPSVVANAAGELVVPIKVRMDGTATGSGRAIEICRLTNSNTVALGNTAEFGGSLIIPGAVVTMYDGANVTALGFHVFPEPPTVSAGPVGNDAVPVTIRYQAVYRWSDAMGRVHRSRPSAPVDVKAPSGTPLNATVTVTPYRLGDKSNVTIELMRSQANVLDVLNYAREASNDSTVQTLNITDTQTDSAIAVNPLLYTTGGVLANDPVPAATEVCLHNERLFLVSMDDQREIGFSQVDNGSDGPGFPDSLLIQRPAAVQALASFAQSLIIFDQGVFHVSPSLGPDPNGRGLYPKAQTVESGTTTVMPLAVLATPDGVMFRPTDPLDGIQMVSKAMQIVPIGLDVQKFNAPIVGSAYVANQCQARFWTAAGTTLVYDCTHNLWSTFSGQQASSGALWNGTPAYVTPAPAVIVEAQNVYTENGSMYDMDIYSPWFSPLGVDKAAAMPNIGGYFLLRNILGIGSGQAGPTRVELRKDFDAATVIASYTGTPGPAWDWLVKGAWKLSMFQVRITETSATAGPVINGFTVGVGPKIGQNRLASGKTLRTT